jgi:serine/threonine protein kinase
MSWGEDWEIITPLVGGGQGSCYLVNRIGDKAKTFFLKELRFDKNQESERRNRFYTETSILKLFQNKIEGLASIVDTNAHQYEDKNIDLYYVSDFINGVTLRKYSESNKLDELAIINLLRQLLQILKQCHSYYIIHRDIKPDNIIVDNKGKLFLVDYGIAFFDLDNEQTSIASEIGNRFLKLPEFLAGSPNKRDPRSDLTLACGIAFYLLFKEYPRDINGFGIFTKPHKSTSIAEKLKSLNFYIYWQRIFDQGFSSMLADRWSCADELLGMLDMMNQTKCDDQNHKDILSKRYDIINIEQLEKINSNLKSKCQLLKSICEQIISAKAPVFRSEYSGRNCNSGDNLAECWIRAYLIDKTKSECITFNCMVNFTGEAIIGMIAVNSQSHKIFNCSLDESLDCQLISQVMENIVLKTLAEFVSS